MIVRHMIKRFALSEDRDIGQCVIAVNEVMQIGEILAADIGQRLHAQAPTARRRCKCRAFVVDGNLEMMRHSA